MSNEINTVILIYLLKVELQMAREESTLTLANQ